AIAAAQRQGVELLVIRIAVAHADAIATLERAGAQRCDTLVTYARKFVHHAERFESSGVRPGSTADAAALAEASRKAFDHFDGHWHADARLDATLATQLYAQWAADLARAASARQPLLIAAGDSGEVSGFLATAERGENRWSVPLAAVVPDRRGSGLLSTMLRVALASLARISHGVLCYETQVGNRAAIRSVEKSGFDVESSRHTYHLWLHSS
ncbi:MAG TPA: GNAT family N-acetyltransferase, partial [Gemmatimonadaceae bacterium]|nr:GNAT family N-acetyltransferase [Gemmatimonadaceae bacterium]